MKKRIRIQGILVFSSVITTIFLSKYLFQNWKEEMLDEFWDIVGIIIILLGFLFRIVARGHKEENSLSGKMLIKDGLYALMRNPMYFGTLLIGLGVVMVIFQWWVFLLFAAVYLGIYFPQVRREEKILLARFGEEYHDYCESTPRYLPKLFPKIKDLCSFIRFKWGWIKREFVSLIAILSMVIFAEAWKDMKSLGGKAYWNELLESFITIIIVILIVNLLFHEKKNC